MAQGFITIEDKGKSFRMPWTETRDPTDAEIDSFIASQGSTSPIQPVKPVSQGGIGEGLLNFGKTLLAGPAAGFVNDMSRARGETTADPFKPILPASNNEYTPETLPSFPMRALKEVGYEDILRPMTSPFGLASELAAGPMFQALKKPVTGLARRLMGSADEIPVPTPRVAPKPVAPITAEAPVMPPEFLSPSQVGPVARPTFPDPVEAAYQSVLQNKGKSPSASLNLTPVDAIKNAEVTKQATSVGKPKVRVNTTDYTKVDLINPTEETLRTMSTRGYAPVKANADGSLAMEVTGVSPVKDISAPPSISTPSFGGGRTPRQARAERAGGVEPVSSVNEVAPKPTDIRLPRELAGAKPNYNFGATSYTPHFQSDLDKAAFIISQKKPSARDADYLKFVMDATGLDEAGARGYGIKVRAAIKTAVRAPGQGPGVVRIPTVGFEAPKSSASKIVELAKSEGFQPTGDDFADIGKAKDYLDAAYGNSNWIEKIDGSTTSPISTGLVPPGGTPPPPKGPTNVSAVAPDPEDAKKLKYDPHWLVKRGNDLKAVKSGLDLSAPLRQGLPLADRKEFWKALPDMIRAGASEEGFEKIQANIRSRPLFAQSVDEAGKPIKSQAEKAGLHLSNLTDVSDKEELIMSNLPERMAKFAPDIKIAAPIRGLGRAYRGSNRAFTGFINKLRADVFESMVKDASKNGPVDDKVMSEIADFVNTFTGRGKLGTTLEKSAEALNAAMYSPRLLSSRLQVLASPVRYANSNPTVRKQALRSWLTLGASQGTIMGLASLHPDVDVTIDPRSTDFGKLRIGNTRIDLGGGHHQLITLASRLLTGKSTTTTGKVNDLSKPKFGGPTYSSTIGRFAMSKEAPAVGLAASLWSGKDFIGREKSRTQLALEGVEPMIIQDLRELAQEDPKLFPAGIAAFLGASIQVHDKKKPKSVFASR